MQTEKNRHEWQKTIRRHLRHYGYTKEETVNAKRFINNLFDDYFHESNAGITDTDLLLKLSERFYSEVLRDGQNIILIGDIIKAVSEEKYKTPAKIGRNQKIKEIQQFYKEKGVSDAFLQILNQYGYFQSVSEEDLDDFLEDIAISKSKNGFLKMTANGITVCFDYWDWISNGHETKSRMRICIDPSYCFNKASQCSIVIEVDGTKRTEKKYESIFRKINEKGKFRQKWMYDASRCWYGDFCNL